MKNKKNLEGNSGLIIVLVVLVVLLGAGGLVFLSKQVSNNKNSNSFQLPFAQTPYDKLLSALEKTSSAKTLYAEYRNKVISSISQSKTGVTQTLSNNVDGSISGSTDGKTGQAEMKIWSDLAPDRSIMVSVVNTENGDWYVKNAASPKWQKFTKEEYKKQTESSPTDASLYGLNILGTLFAENQALLKSVKKDTVESLGKETADATTYSKYRVEISTPDFINALSTDKDRTPNEVNDSKTILQNSVLSAIFYVEDSTNYVKKLHVEAKKLQQIPNAQADQLGIRTTHDITLDADLSRFNVATNISAPDVKDVLGVSTKLQKITLPQ